MLVEIGEEIFFLRLLVGESELAFQDGNLALGTDAFGGNQFLFIGIFILLRARFVDQVEAEVFAARHFIGLRVADGRIVVQVERYLTGWKQALAECDFGDCHIL